MIPACYEFGTWIETGDPRELAATTASGVTAGAPSDVLGRARHAHAWTTERIRTSAPADRVTWLRIHEYVRGVTDGLQMAGRLRPDRRAP